MTARFNGNVYLFEFRVVELAPEGAARTVAGRGAFVQAVRRLDTAVAEDIEHAPSGEGGGPGCAGERRSTAETIVVKPDGFLFSRFAGSRDDEPGA